MNVKSRAQLIVWCMPHLGFVEKEERQAQASPIIREAAQPAQEAANTIPAGSATVAQSIPHVSRIGGNIGSSSGSNGPDAGAYGF